MLHNVVLGQKRWLAVDAAVVVVVGVGVRFFFSFQSGYLKVNLLE